MLKKLFFWVLIIIELSACTTSSVLVNVQSPAHINIPEDIRNVVVVNRSLPSKDNLAGNIIENLISGEVIGTDRKGAGYCVEGLVSVLTNSERFTLKNKVGIELKGTGSPSFPMLLDWNEVKSICGSYDSDALLVLETFDSDSSIGIGIPVVSMRKEKGKQIKELRYPATLTMSVESGWRIYDVTKENIIDENKFIDIKEFSAWGHGPAEAKLNLPTKRNMIKKSAIFAGAQYGRRISPIWATVSRTYYTGNSDDLKLARSYVKLDDWDAAIDIWKDLVDSSDEKTARRSTYNMAIASEIKGELDAAIEWVKQAQKLGEKRAYNYINILERRKIDEEKLK